MLHFFVRKAVDKPKRLKSKVKNAHKAKQVDSLARRSARALSVAFADGIKKFKKRIDWDAIEDAWEAGQHDQLDKHIPWEKLHDDMKPASDLLAGILLGAAGAALQNLPPRAEEAKLTRDSLKIRNYVTDRTGDLVVGITHDTKVGIRKVVTRSFQTPMSPRQVANEIKGSIGLHDRYKNALRNYKAGLVEQGKDPKEVEELGAKYEARLLDSRAMTIARTETRRAANEGQRQMWREAADQGFIDKNTARRVWVVDGNPCEICEPMDGMEVGLDEIFTLPDGTQADPGDAHPNCECIEILELE